MTNDFEIISREEQLEIHMSKILSASIILKNKKISPRVDTRIDEYGTLNSIMWKSDGFGDSVGLLLMTDNSGNSFYNVVDDNMDSYVDDREPDVFECIELL